MDYIKSPIFYMGNKYELLPQLLHIFPKNIDTFYDMFGGSGVVSLNVSSNNVVYNEFNSQVYNLIKILKEKNADEITNIMESNKEKFDLGESIDIRGGNSNKVKQSKKKYISFRKYYNDTVIKKTNNYIDLYLLTYYSFCQQMRFNSKGEFNMPRGNNCYTPKTHNIEIAQACYQFKKKNILFKNSDAIKLLKEIKFNENDFIYIDPPYLNTTAIYNEQRGELGGWNMVKEKELLNELDFLNGNGVKWCLSNVKENKGITNQHLIDWANKNNYRIIGMEKNYSALGKGNSNTYEICIINYDYSGDGFKVLQEKLNI